MNPDKYKETAVNYIRWVERCEFELIMITLKLNKHLKIIKHC